MQENIQVGSKPGSLGPQKQEDGVGAFHIQTPMSGVLVLNWQYHPLPSGDDGSAGRDPVKSEWLAAPPVAFQKGLAQTSTQFSGLLAAIERQVTSSGIASFTETLRAGRPYTLGVTSAVVGEGKTTVAMHLAMNAARNTFQRVCLIDLSLGEDTICQRLGAVTSGIGIIGLLEEPDQTFPPMQMKG